MIILAGGIDYLRKMYALKKTPFNSCLALVDFKSRQLHRGKRCNRPAECVRALHRPGLGHGLLRTGNVYDAESPGEDGNARAMDTRVVDLLNLLRHSTGGATQWSVVTSIGCTSYTHHAMKAGHVFCYKSRECFAFSYR